MTKLSLKGGIKPLLLFLWKTFWQWLIQNTLTAIFLGVGGISLLTLYVYVKGTFLSEVWLFLSTPIRLKLSLFYLLLFLAFLPLVTFIAYKIIKKIKSPYYFLVEFNLKWRVARQTGELDNLSKNRI